MLNRDILKKKNALVTGSTSGIGLATAEGLAAEGCNIVLSGIPVSEDPKAICARIESTYKVKAIYIAADLTDRDAPLALATEAARALGGIDILVNNAGMQHVAPTLDFPDEKWDQMRALMLDAPFRLIKAVLPHMISKKWGRIVNTASVHGIVSAQNKVAYISLKHAIVGMTKAVASDVSAMGVTCNAVGPATVMTDLIKNQLPSQAALHNCTEEEALQRIFLSRIPTRKIIETEEIAAAVCYLCSDGAKSVTGALLMVDGGYTAE